MSRVRLVHWNADEAAEKAELLMAAGHEVRHGGEFKDWKRDPVDVVVIDLSRLPSHGREVATALRGTKATRQIPLVFVGGAAEKVEAIRTLLPDAVYTVWPRMVGALKKLRPVEAPVAPLQMMDRYAGRTLAQKLGIKEGCTVTVVDPPRDYLQILGDLPPGVEVAEDSGAPSDVTLCFVRDHEALAENVVEGRRRAAKTKLWICWPKGKKGQINENDIRNAAINLGLVDYKVCSVSATWSGLALAVKKT